MPEITLDHIRQAAEWASSQNGLIEGRKYTQESWDCGTACCIWGAASLLAGAGAAKEGPSSKWASKSAKHSILAGLMGRTNEDVLPFIEAVAADDWTSFAKMKFRWNLYLSGCDLKGITLPTTIDGYLYLSGCDLKGITLPTTIGGSLDLSGCDLKGITLPTTIGGYLYLSGCDLKGITLPTTIDGSLDLSGATNIPSALPKVSGSIYR